MASLRTLVKTTAATCAALMTAGALVAAQQKGDKREEGKRPKLSLKVQPQVAMAPARVLLTAEVVGGSDDFEEYYCPTIEWEWGDETSSESTSDCDPYEAGKSQIKRRYTTQHQFQRAGSYKLFIHLKQRDRVVASASTVLQVQPGVGFDPDSF